MSRRRILNNRVKSSRTYPKRHAKAVYESLDKPEDVLPSVNRCVEYDAYLDLFNTNMVNDALTYSDWVKLTYGEIVSNETYQQYLRQIVDEAHMEISADIIMDLQKQITDLKKQLEKAREQRDHLARLLDEEIKRNITKNDDEDEVFDYSEALEESTRKTRRAERDAPGFERMRRTKPRNFNDWR